MIFPDINTWPVCYGINRDAHSAPPPITIAPTSGMMIHVMI
jgi:hypothetical protein